MDTVRIQGEQVAENIVYIEIETIILFGSTTLVSRTPPIFLFLFSSLLVEGR